MTPQEFYNKWIKSNLMENQFNGVILTYNNESVKKDFLKMIKNCWKPVEEDYINDEIERIKIKE